MAGPWLIRLRVFAATVQDQGPSAFCIRCIQQELHLHRSVLGQNEWRRQGQLGDSRASHRLGRCQGELQQTGAGHQCCAEYPMVCEPGVLRERQATGE